MWMQWWLWLLLGLFLLLCELLTPGGFYIIFFGVGAVVVGVLSLMNLAGPLWLQWLLFSVISVGTLVLFRRPLLRMVEPVSRTHDVDSLVGETAVALEDIPAGAIGKAEMRGTSWTARNVGAGALARGQRCKVERVEGLMLCVRSE
jgi:membrane protein implicated in regulation of membrane protease activity